MESIKYVDADGKTEQITWYFTSNEYRGILTGLLILAKVLRTFYSSKEWPNLFNDASTYFWFSRVLLQE